jgi:CubicO group peptidase (beta-lactamase class C family)
MRIPCLLALLVLFPTASLFAQAVYYPPRGSWAEKTPAEMGVDAAKLKAAVDFALAQESPGNRNLKIAHYQGEFGREPFGYPIGPMKNRGPATGLIIYKGYLIAQWGEPERVDLTFSVAKSFLSAVVGLAVDRQLIQSEKDLVHPYMGPIIPYNPGRLAENKADHLLEEDVFDLFEGSHNKKITWEHLLRQRSDWEGSLWGKPDWADRPEGKSEGWISRPRHEPGTVFKYNDTRVNVLALAALQVWRKPLPVVLKEELMDKIGASPTWRWTGYENSFVILDGQIVQSVSGGSHWGGGLLISAFDQARFGYLTLRKGKWKEEQVISESWLQRSRTPGSGQPGYGFMNYFLNTDRKSIPAAPESAFFHLGAGANMIYVDEVNDLLVVSRWIKNDQKGELIKMVLESLPKE